MPTYIRHFQNVPPVPAESVVDGTIEQCPVRTGDGYAMLGYGPENAPDLHQEEAEGTVMNVLERRGWELLPEADLDGERQVGLSDTYHRRHSRVWRYWITTPDAQLPGVRDFVAAAEAGGLPKGWTEKAADDQDADPYTVCTFRLTMDGARSLGAEQSALMALADLPEGVFFFQTVADIDGFTGVEKESRQPTTLDTALYEPGDLFQTSHPDAAGQRGSAFDETDVLDVTGLTLT